ncbi:MAG: hypothetical protein SVY53_00945 [Chloroflexota bacterium]|nr:hypothetical protein [Chloroflexota bacterium]
MTICNQVMTLSLRSGIQKGWGVLDPGSTDCVTTMKYQPNVPCHCEPKVKQSRPKEEIATSS